MTLKEDRIKYLIVGVISFLCIPSSFIATIFQPLYNRVNYGQINDYFKYGIGIVFLLIAFLVIQLVIKKKLHMTYERDTSPLSLKKTIIVFFLTFGIIFAISAYLGFEVKIFHDLGKNANAFKLGKHATKCGYYAIVGLFITLMIENFQYAFDGAIKSKRKIINYIPLGGLCTMLTYGTYALCMGFGTMKILFFFLILVYGEIYLLTNRSFLKTCACVMLIILL